MGDRSQTGIDLDLETIRNERTCSISLGTLTPYQSFSFLIPVLCDFVHHSLYTILLETRDSATMLLVMVSPILVYNLGILVSRRRRSVLGQKMVHTIYIRRASDIAMIRRSVVGSSR